MRQPLAQTPRAIVSRLKYPEIAEKHREREAERKKRRPEMLRAHGIVRRAVLAGKITPGPCEKCGAAGVKVHAHHADYSKPLDVQWLCVSCHWLTHTGGTKKPPRQPRPPKPPNPSRFKITLTKRGWVKKIDGRTRWICSIKEAPTVEAVDRFFAEHFTP